MSDGWNANPTSAVSAMTSVLAGLFSISGLVAFTLGVGTVYVWNHIKIVVTKRRTPKVRINKMWAGWVVVTLAVAFVGVKTQQTWDCQSQFAAVLKTRSELSAQDNKLDGIERDALQTLVSQALSPPPDIAPLPPDDPKRQAWGREITLDYFNTVQDARNQRDANQKEREQHPLPEPSCGRT